MSIQNISNIINSKIRIFPFQTKDYSFILYPDLQTSYLLSLLINKIGYKLNQFFIDQVYPTQKYVEQTIKNILTNYYIEDYYVFYLENYYHSSDYALGFVELILSKIELLDKKPYIIIHTLKTPKNEIKELIKKYEFIVLIVNGDFEEFFYEFHIKKTDIKDIVNIVYRDDQNIIHINPNTKVLSDLNLYIFPAYSFGNYIHFQKSKDYITSLIDEDKGIINELSHYNILKEEFIKLYRYLPETSIMLTTGRGCKYKCSYCYRGVKYSSVRQISLDTIKQDLDYLQKYQYKYIYLYDDCFITTNLDRLDSIIHLLSQYDFEYGIAARFEVCSEENLLKLSKINIKRIQIGLQSISKEVNNKTKRGFNPNQFEKTVKKMNDLGISLSLDIILGLPGEGLVGFMKTFNYAVSLKPDSIFINSLFLNPGTELYTKKDEYGIVTDTDGDKKKLFYVGSILSSNTFSEKDILFARKYVLYCIKNIKDIYIVLR